MMNDNEDGLTNLIEIISDMNVRELSDVNELVDEIVKYKYQDEHSISCVFDRMLSIEFIDEDNLKKPYYKLLKYARKIDKDFADDYEKFLLKNSQMMKKNILISNMRKVGVKSYFLCYNYL